MGYKIIFQCKICKMRNLDAWITNAAPKATRIAAVEILHCIELHKGWRIDPFRMTMSVCVIIIFTKHYCFVNVNIIKKALSSRVRASAPDEGSLDTITRTAPILRLLETSLLWVKIPHYKDFTAEDGFLTHSEWHVFYRNLFNRPLVLC